MERQVYILLQEMYELVSRQDTRALSIAEQERLKATLHSLLVVYVPDAGTEAQEASGGKLDGIQGEARRPPRYPVKKHWWEKLSV